MGRKHCGKRRNCSLRAISPFSTVFSKGLFPRGIKRCHRVGMGYAGELLLYQKKPTLYESSVEGFENFVGKGEFLQFSTML